MRVLYLTIDNVNDNVILAQTLPFLGRLATFPEVEAVHLYALRKEGGERFRDYLPARVHVHLRENHGLWSPRTWGSLARLAWAAWRTTTPGALCIGRNPVCLACLLPAARRASGRLVLDYRGLLSEEYALQGKVARGGTAHRLLRRLEGWALRRADRVLCVSYRLATRARRWQPQAAGKLAVVPCACDPGVARRDEGAVEAVRRDLSLEANRDFVLVYAGSLSAWNRPALIRDLFRAAAAARPSVKLLVLTGDLARAEEVFAGEPGVLLRTVPHAAIRAYLAVGDLGLLLRDSHPVNRVASPVKFAEYLACGIPVLVSPGVGDCAGIVERERVGFVLRPDSPLGAILARVAADRAGYASRGRETARRLFDADRYQDIYRELVKIR